MQARSVAALKSPQPVGEVDIVQQTMHSAGLEELMVKRSGNKELEQEAVGGSTVRGSEDVSERSNVEEPCQPEAKKNPVDGRTEQRESVSKDGRMAQGETKEMEVDDQELDQPLAFLAEVQKRACPRGLRVS